MKNKNSVLEEEQCRSGMYEKEGMIFLRAALVLYPDSF